MNNYIFKDRDGSTPLESEQLKGIRFPHITTMGELDEVEDENIGRGLDWLNRQKPNDYLSINFLNELHRKLFDDVWKWAGKYRIRDVNLSKISPYEIGHELKLLFDNTKAQIYYKSMPWDEIVAEFHHKLVSIHPYPNGNGRMARIMTEYLQKRNNQKITSWMGSLANSPKERRKKYIQALVAADSGDYSTLIEFMKEKQK